MARRNLTFICQNCGSAYGRWQGKCDACGEWNTLSEEGSADARAPGVGGGFAGSYFVAHDGQSCGGWTHPYDAGVHDALCKRSVLGKEPVAGVYGVGSRLAGNLDNPIDVQVRLGGRSRGPTSTWQRRGVERVPVGLAPRA